jgi:hypothetical protein
VNDEIMNAPDSNGNLQPSIDYSGPGEPSVSGTGAADPSRENIGFDEQQAVVWWKGVEDRARGSNTALALKGENHGSML